MIYKLSNQKLFLFAVEGGSQNKIVSINKLTNEILAS